MTYGSIKAVSITEYVTDKDGTHFYVRIVYKNGEEITYKYEGHHHKVVKDFITNGRKTVYQLRNDIKVVLYEL